MAEKIYGFKENGTKIEVPAKADLENLGGSGAGYIYLDPSSPAYTGEVDSCWNFDLWKLTPGLYHCTDIARLYYGTQADMSEESIGTRDPSLYIGAEEFGGWTAELRVYDTYDPEENSNMEFRDMYLSSGSKIFHITMLQMVENGTEVVIGAYSRIVPEVIDDLTNTSTDKALSAYQGKVLNDKIEQCKIINVTELPEIKEENKNQILRYNGELYAVGLGYIDQYYNDDTTFDLTINQGETAYFDFSKIPAFAATSDFPQYVADGNTWNDTSTPFVLCSCRYTDTNFSDEEVLYEIVVAQSSKYNIVVGEALNQDYDNVFPIAEYSYNQGIIEGSLLYNNNGDASFTIGHGYYFGSFNNPNVTYHFTFNGNTLAYGIFQGVALRKVYSTWKKLNEDIEYSTRIENIYNLESQELAYFYLQHGDVCTKVPYHTSNSLWGEFYDYGYDVIAQSDWRSGDVFIWNDEIGATIDTSIFGSAEQKYKIAEVNSRYDRIIPNHIYHIELIGNEINSLFLIKKLSDYATSGELQATHFDQILADFDGKVGFILNDVGQLMICGINSYWGDMIQIACQVPYGWTNDKRQVSFIWDNYNRHFCVFASNTSGSWKTSRYSETLEVDTSMQDPS